MGDEFYAVIKLVSGEEIFSSVCVDENEGDPVLILYNPVIMKTITLNEVSMVKIKPWIELTDENIFIIRLDKIITMTESRDEKIIEVYNRYNDENLIDEQNIKNYDTNGKVGVSTQMGYITSVEEARKNLEKIFKDLKED